MPLSAELIHKLKMASDGALRASAEDLETLATEYRSHCLDALKRLDEVSDWLAQGQRAQAIHLAESPPPLLDVIATLDFNGVEKWRAFASDKGLPLSLEFPSAKIQAIEDAYGQNEALQPLQQAYQRANLKGSPASERIDILRRVRALDSANPTWEKELTALEARLFREISDRLSRPERIEEDEAKRMVQELTNEQLLSEPISGLVARARELHLKLKTKRVHKTMRRMVDLVNADYGAMALEGLSRGLDQLDSLSSLEQVPIPNSLQTEIEEAKAWRAEQERIQQNEIDFRKHVQDLGIMLDREATAAEVRKQVRTVKRFDRDVPGALMERAESYLAGLELAEEQRRRSKRMLIGAAVVLAVLAVGLVVWVTLERRERTRTIAQITIYRESMDFDGGHRFLGTIEAESPRLARHPAVLQARKDLERAEDRERVRARRLASTLDQSADLDPLDAKQRTLLADAERLVRLEEDRELFAARKARVDAAVSERTAQAVQEAKKLLAQADTLYSDLRGTDRPEQMRPLLSSLEEALADAKSLTYLPEDMIGVIKDYRTRLSVEEDRATKIEIEEKEAELRFRKAQSTLRSARGTLLSNPEEYAKALSDHRPEFPDVPEFQQLGRWTPVFEEYLRVVAFGKEMSRFLRDCKRSKLLPFLPSPQALAKLQAELPEGIPSLYARFLEQQEQRWPGYVDTDADDLKRITETLSHELIVGLHQLTVTDKGGGQTVYYTAGASKRQDRELAVALRVYLGRTFRLQDKAWPKERYTVSGTVPAPHCQMGQSLLKQLESSFRTPDWKPFAPGALGSLVQLEGASPWPQAVMINALVQFDKNTRNSLQLPETLQDDIRRLSESRIHFWIPDDPEVNGDLRALATRLGLLRPKVENHLKQIDEAWISRMFELAALCRPLVFSGVVTSEAGAEELAVTPIEAGKSSYPEYWSINAGADRMEFQIVAFRQPSGDLEIVDQAAVVPGQPLLSPADGTLTAEHFQELCKMVGRPTGRLSLWPTNTDRSTP